MSSNVAISKYSRRVVIVIIVLNSNWMSAWTLRGPTPQLQGASSLSVVSMLWDSGRPGLTPWSPSRALCHFCMHVLHVPVLLCLSLYLGPYVCSIIQLSSHAVVGAGGQWMAWMGWTASTMCLTGRSPQSRLVWHRPCNAHSTARLQMLRWIPALFSVEWADDRQSWTSWWAWQEDEGGSPQLLWARPYEVHPKLLHDYAITRKTLERCMLLVWAVGLHRSAHAWGPRCSKLVSMTSFV